MNRSEQKIDNIMNSLDGIHRAEARPFMYTRIAARMQNDEKNIWSRIGATLAKPVVAFACLASVLATNVYFITKGNSNTDTATVSTINSATEILQSDSYTLAVNNTDY